MAQIVVRPAVLTGTCEFKWLPSRSPGIASYQFYYGTISGIYTNSTNVGLATNYVFAYSYARTNPTRFFVAITATDTNGIISPFSNEAHYPKFPPVLTGLVLNAVGPVTASPDLIQWGPFTNTLPATLPAGSGAQFFKGTNVTLTPAYQPAW